MHDKPNYRAANGSAGGEVGSHPGSHNMGYVMRANSSALTLRLVCQSSGTSLPFFAPWDGSRRCHKRGTGAPEMAELLMKSAIVTLAWRCSGQHREPEVAVRAWKPSQGRADAGVPGGQATGVWDQCLAVAPEVLSWCRSQYVQPMICCQIPRC